jgi:hypothetical protein
VNKRLAAQERRIFWLKTFFAIMALGAVLKNDITCIPLVIAAALMWAPVRARLVNLSKGFNQS